MRQLRRRLFGQLTISFVTCSSASFNVVTPGSDFVFFVELFVAGVYRSLGLQ